MIEVNDTIATVWEPTKKQSRFIELPFNVLEALYGGAAGAGKSELLILLPIIYGFYKHPLFKGIILRRTFPELEAEIITRSQLWYPYIGGVYNEAKKVWKFPAYGSRIYFGHCEKEEDVRKYDSAQYNYIGWDEATSFTQFQYQYLSFSRGRSATSDLPVLIRAATNPGNVGHYYFRERFVTPLLKYINSEHLRLIKDPKTGLLRTFIQATIFDNPHVLKNNPQYQQQLESLPEAEKRAKLLGDWFTFTGQVFKEFRLEPYIDEPENARHVIDPFDIPAYWPKGIGIDWGYAAMTWIGHGAISPTNRAYVFKEYAEKEKKTIDWITDLINSVPKEEREYYKFARICHSADQQRGEFETIAHQVQKALSSNGFHMKVELASRDRIAGKMNLHEYLRWQPKSDIIRQVEPYNEEYAQKLYRLFGSKEYNLYMQTYTEKEPETNLPKLQIFRTCQKLIETIPHCVYDDRKNKDGKIVAEDVREFDGDDPYDGIRMLIGGFKDYMAGNAKAIEEMRAKENDLNKLAETNDWNAYHQRSIKRAADKPKPYSFRRRGFRLGR